MKKNYVDNGYCVLTPDFTRKHELILKETLTLANSGGRVNDALFHPMAWEVIRHSIDRISDVIGYEMQFYGDFVMFVRRKETSFTGFIGAHRDMPDVGRESFDGDVPGSCVVWVALTDATLTNSCVHVLPRQFDKDYFNAGLHLEIPPNHLDKIRALPVEKGSIIVLGNRVIHWGSPTIEGERVALSFTLVNPKFIRPKITRPPLNRVEIMSILAAMDIWYYDHNPVDALRLKQLIRDFKFDTSLFNEGYLVDLYRHIQNLKFGLNAVYTPKRRERKGGVMELENVDGLSLLFN